MNTRSVEEAIIVETSRNGTLDVDVYQMARLIVTNSYVLIVSNPFSWELQSG